MFSYQIDKNLKLVLPQNYHSEELTVVVRENLVELKLWMPWATDEYSVESATDYIKNNLRGLAETGSFGVLVVADEKISGSIGFHNLDLANKLTHIGYWLAKDAQGKGIMTQCCTVLIDYLFDDLGLNRVQINCNVENTKSRAIPERLGFSLEGSHRQVELVNGRFGDWAVYAMLKSDWNALNKSKK